MSKKKNQWNKTKVHSSVNPQGLSEDDINTSPKSQLEQRAKKKNTKI